MSATASIDLVGMVRQGPGKYESRGNPQAMGNAQKIAYGGCAIANAIHATYQDLPSPKYHVYSVMGNYLGPAYTDRKLIAYTHHVRETRTFVTRRVELKQVMDTGEERSVLMALVDFQAAEPASMFTYSAPPVIKYSGHDEALEVERSRELVLEKANDPSLAKLVKLGSKLFGLMPRHFDQRVCPEGLGSQNIWGLARHVKTTQDHLPITSKTSADWYRAIDSTTIQAAADHYALAGFLMDAGLSFIPLTHNHQFLDEAAACSSLDFALRFFTHGLDMHAWHLREMKTITGGGGRTYSEAQMWDDKGVMVASMTQQSIMRPPKKAKI